MKKISKPTVQKKKQKLKKVDTLFTKDVISLDDKHNRKYLDEFAYQSYLAKLNNGSDDFNE